MKLIKIQNTTFKSKIPTFWPDINEFDNSVLININIPYKKIDKISKMIFNQDVKLNITTEEWDEFIKYLITNNKDYDHTIKLLYTTKNIFHGKPKTNIYSLPETIFEYLLGNNYQFVDLNNLSADKKFDFLKNLSLQKKIVPLKSGFYIETNETLSFEYSNTIYNTEEIIINQIFND